MEARGDLLPTPDDLSDEDDLSEEEPWDSDTEEDIQEPWLINPIQPADPKGFSIYYTNVQSLRYKLDQIYHDRRNSGGGFERDLAR